MAIQMTRDEYEAKYGSAPTVLSKQTRQQAQQPQRSLLDRVSGGITNFIGARPIVDTFATEIAAFRADTPEEKALIRNDAPTTKEVVGSAAETGSMFLPGAGVGATLARKAVVGAGTGFGVEAGQSLQEDEGVKDALTPGALTAVGAIIPVVGSIIGIAPRALEKANLRLTPVEQQNLIKRGKDIVGYLTKQKIVGTPQQRLSKINALYQSMEDRVQKEIAEAGLALPKETILDHVRSMRSQFLNDPLILPEFDRAAENFTEFIQGKSTYAIPLSEVNDFKRNIMERAFAKNKTDVINEARYAIGTALKDLVVESVPNLKKLNLEYSDIITARGILRKAATRNQTGLLTRALATGVGAATGGTVGGFLGAGIGGVASERLVNTLATPVRSATGATVQTLGDVLNKLPVDEQGNISVKVLLQILSGEEDEDTE